MLCAEMENFTARYVQAVRAYRLATVELIDKRGEESLEHSHEVGRLNVLARKAYLDLERHIRTHGCGSDLRTATSG